MSAGPLARDFDEAMRLVRVYMPDARRQSDLLRAVRVGTVARAVVIDDPATADRACGELGEIHPELVHEIAVALRTILDHEPARTGWPDPADRLAWRGRVWRALRAAPNGERIADAITWRALRREGDWREVACAAHAGLQPGERLVVFGLGANGALAAGALAQAGRDALACDDRPEATSPLPRIARGELGPSDVVLVTPDGVAGIVHDLHQAGVRRTLLPEHVWLAQAAPAG